jgi:ArsR family transcriptional regulator
MNGDICDVRAIHEDIVDSARNKMPADDTMAGLAAFHRILGDVTRIKILFALMVEEMCVCDLSVLMNMKQSAISHQLRQLKQAGLVKNRRDGKVIYYSLFDDHVRSVFEQSFLLGSGGTREAIHA